MLPSRDVEELSEHSRFLTWEYFLFSEQLRIQASPKQQVRAVGYWKKERGVQVKKILATVKPRRCQITHDLEGNCLSCGKDWQDHNGHYCPPEYLSYGYWPRCFS